MVQKHQILYSDCNCMYCTASLLYAIQDVMNLEHWGNLHELCGNSQHLPNSVLCLQNDSTVLYCKWCCVSRSYFRN